MQWTPNLLACTGNLRLEYVVFRGYQRLGLESVMGWCLEGCPSNSPCLRPLSTAQTLITFTFSALHGHKI